MKIWGLQLPVENEKKEMTYECVCDVEVPLRGETVGGAGRRLACIRILYSQAVENGGRVKL